MNNKHVIKNILLLLLISIWHNTLYAQACGFTASITPTHIACNGMNTGAATVVESPAGAYTYQWSTGATTKQISNVYAATYFVKITDIYGCEVLEFITLTQPTKLETTATISNPICYNENSGYITLEPSGGVAPYTYAWSNNASTPHNSQLYSGTYSVSISDSHACKIEKTYVLTQPEKITTVAAVSEVRGYGLADGAINITTSGGVHPYQYEWSNDNNYTATTEDIFSIPSTLYHLHIRDSRACNYDTSIFMPQPPPLSLTSKITNVFCNAYNDGAIEVFAQGGVPPYTYTWANPYIVLTENSSKLSNISTGNYYLTITDNNGITLVDSFFVDEPFKIIGNIRTTDAFCFDSLNGNAYLTISGGTAPFSYMWSNGSNTQNIEHVRAGTYSVQIVDANGCFLRLETSINEPPILDIESLVTHITCKDHYNGKISTKISGGIPPYKYEWSNGASTQNIEMLTAGVYTITVHDANNCPMKASNEVKIPINGCIEIPNTFTPNGDNINDTWVITNSYVYPEIEVQIVNQQGYIVFKSIGYNKDWDGTYNENPIPSGTYYYIVNLHNGDPIYKGIVTIIR